MRIVTILNMSDSSNKGDLAILESTVYLIKRIYPDTTLKVLNADYDVKTIQRLAKFHYLDELGVQHNGSFFPGLFCVGGNLIFRVLVGMSNFFKSLYIICGAFIIGGRFARFLPQELKEPYLAILEADLVILKGGSYIYSYGGWKQVLFVYRLFLSTIIAILLRKRIIAFGHSIGPIFDNIPTILARFCLNRIDKIIVRESISKDFLLNQLGIDRSKIEILPDLAFWYQAQKKDCSFLSRSILDNSRLKLGLTVRNWHFPQKDNPEKRWQNYICVISEISRRFQNTYNGKVFLMPHAEEDYKITDELSQKTNAIFIKNDFTTWELRQMYGLMDIFVGTRIHSCIFALSMGVPTIAIAYEIPKGLGIISMVEDKSCVLDIANLSVEDLWMMIEILLKEKEQRRIQIQEKVANFKDKIEKEFEALLR